MPHSNTIFRTSYPASLAEKSTGNHFYFSFRCVCLSSFAVVRFLITRIQYQTDRAILFFLPMFQFIYMKEYITTTESILFESNFLARLNIVSHRRTNIENGNLTLIAKICVAFQWSTLARFPFFWIPLIILLLKSRMAFGYAFSIVIISKQKSFT